MVWVFIYRTLSIDHVTLLYFGLRSVVYTLIDLDYEPVDYHTGLLDKNYALIAAVKWYSYARTFI